MKVKGIKWYPGNQISRRQLSEKFILCVSLCAENKKNQCLQNVPCENHIWMIGEQGRFSQQLVYGRQIRDYCQQSRILTGTVNIGYFSELLAFLDAAYQGYSDENTYRNSGTQNKHNGNVCLRYSELEQLFIIRYIRRIDDFDFVSLCKFIRQQESYIIASYLIGNYINSDIGNVTNLSKRYGLSYSNFRKKTQLYFGDTAKNRMQAWRLTKTMLDIVETKESLTHIAMNNGFSSQSHLNQVILSSFGMTPSSLRKINGKL
ncbi:TPA: helix-turn-helix domain-containing protein [Citrobacter freundii]